MDANDMSTLVRELSDPASRRRFDALRDMVISMGKRNGWIHDGMTREEALKVTFDRIGGKGTQCEPEKSTVREEVIQSERQEPKMKEIRIRLVRGDWKRIGERARKFHTTRCELAKRLILEGLNALGRYAKT